MVRVDNETKELIDSIRAANRISANEVIKKMIKREKLTPPKSETTLNPNDEYRLQRLEAFFSNKNIDLDKEMR